ncbi:MAG: Burkholderia phage [Pseudomonadota bacterium]|jgi:hypothetical protein
MLPLITPSAHGRFAPRPCWHCQYWGGWVAEIHSRCTRPNGVAVKAVPADGCAFWTREPGADDEAVRPPGQAAA